MDIIVENFCILLTTVNNFPTIPDEYRQVYNCRKD
jgi:hypothetical protein